MKYSLHKILNIFLVSSVAVAFVQMHEMLVGAVLSPDL